MSDYQAIPGEDHEEDEEEVWSGEHGDMGDHYYGSTRSNDIGMGESGGSNRRGRTRSINSHLIHTSLSISTLARPSDDRKNHAILAGWNVSNMIQGTGILGIPYAVQQVRDDFVLIEI